MSNHNSFLMNISVLYRYTQKYFDKQLAKYHLGSGQMIFLLLVNEHEGISMQQLTMLGDFDKGTTTKSIQKLESEAYIQIRNDINDKRVKRLYTTNKANEIMNELYQIRNDCCNQLMEGLDLNKMEDDFQLLTDNSLSFDDESFQDLRIAGLQKLTLLDYPDHVACTIFTGGCNFKCPFCHNRDLVFLPENMEYQDIDELFDFLKKRKGILDAVCISGGEPLLQKGLLSFIKEIKKLGYKIKLDTNGSYPKQLKTIIESGYIDYVAMDIKNCKEKYAQTIGINEYSEISKIEESMQYLMNSDIEYEFRTTIVKELHNSEDIESLAKWIKGAKHYYLQQFIDSGNCIEKNYHAYELEEMEQLQEICLKYVPNTLLRGTK